MISKNKREREVNAQCFMASLDGEGLCGRMGSDVCMWQSHLPEVPHKLSHNCSSAILHIK